MKLTSFLSFCSYFVRGKSRGDARTKKPKKTTIHTIRYELNEVTLVSLGTSFWGCLRSTNKTKKTNKPPMGSRAWQ